MSKRVTYTCMICEKNKVICSEASDGSNVGDSGFGLNRPVCKDWECQEEMRERMKKHGQEQSKKQAEEIWEKIKEIIKRDEELYINFEPYALSEKQKQVCRLYKEKCEDLKKLKREKDELLKCQKCHKKPRDGKYYEVGGEGNYCKSCAEELVENSNESPTYSPNQPTSNKSCCNKCGSSQKKLYENTKLNDGKLFCNKCYDDYYHSKETCDECNQEIDKNEKSYYVDAKSKSGTLCEICWKVKKNSNAPPNDHDEFNSCPSCNKEINSESEVEEHAKQNPQCKSAGEVYEQIEKGLKVAYNKLNLSKQGRIIIKTLQEIKIDKKWVDVNKLDLPNQQKKRLKKLMKDLGITRENKDYSYNHKRDFFSTGLGLGIAIAGWILVLTIIISLIVWVVKKKKEKIIKKTI